jgi:hypothetical protein
MKYQETWCGNFHAQNSLWGSTHTDANGTIVCLNDGCGTGVDVVRGVTYCLDPALASNSIASTCEWNVMNDSVG